MTGRNLYQLLRLGLISWALTACSSLRQRSDTMELNQIFNISPHQTLYAYTRKGGVLTKQLTQPARAALYERQDTLYAEFLSETLPRPDRNAQTIDQSDSLAVFFVHYNPTLKKIEEKSAWFKYKSTAFDMDMFTMPLQYRFAHAGFPGELNDFGLNLGLHAGIRTDLGRYRTVYFRRNQRSEIRSVSFGLGGIIGLSPAAVTSFNTAGRVADEYQALGINYGLGFTFSYSTFSAGLAVGYEKLADYNNKIWIYDRQPWLGLTLGINLN